jgi:hypothetical protein
MERLYIVVRRDLPAGAQAAQSCHALRAFVGAHPDLDRAWHEAGGNLVCLSATDERALEGLLAEASGLATAAFREQDLGGELTAIALEARAKKILRPLPLALCEYARSAA